MLNKKKYVSLSVCKSNVKKEGVFMRNKEVKRKVLCVDS